MHVSSDLHVVNGRILKQIGRITAVSSWHGEGGGAGQQEKALRRLIELAKEYEADAIIGVDYAGDGARALDIAEIPVQRVLASGIAVKLARAA